ncbi:MAG TPA: TIGR03435 family protein [Bryobacteraceae bacterium]|nr:TIGR03435 family protein [Bryobacteraceae bacterium]
MKKFFSIPILLAAAIHHGHCQDLPKPLAFDVASIDPSKPGTSETLEEHLGTLQLTYPGGRLQVKDIDVKYLFEWAYRMLPAQHSSGPSWFDSDRYTIVATGNPHASDDQMRLMTQTLLVDRFKLKMHREPKELPVLAVTVGKNGPKLLPVKEGEVFGMQMTPQGSGSHPVFHVVGTKFTMAQMVNTFARHFDNILLDRTGIQGEFDFTMDLTPDENGAHSMQSMIVEAMQSQLGLAVKSQKATVDYYVIDSMEKVAAGN